MHQLYPTQSMFQFLPRAIISRSHHHLHSILNRTVKLLLNGFTIRLSSSSSLLNWLDSQRPVWAKPLKELIGLAKPVSKPIMLAQIKLELGKIVKPKWNNLGKTSQGLFGLGKLVPRPLKT